MALVLSRLVTLIIAVGLAGCQLVSDKPLMPVSEAQTVFGPSFVALSVHEGGYISDKGELGLIRASASGGSYTVATNEASDASNFLRFFAAPGLPFDYLVEMGSAQRTTYLAARKIPTGLAVLNIDLMTGGLADALKNRGVKLDYVDTSYRVSSRKDLDEVIRAWAAAKFRDPANVDFPYRFEIATGERDTTALLVRGMSQLCFANAGHWQDPEVKKMAPKFAFGVALNSIDADKAKQACGWSDATDGPPAARYSLARALIKAKEFDKANAIVDSLVKQDLPLAHVMLADQLLRGEGRPQDIKAGRDILSNAAKRHGVAAYWQAVLSTTGQVEKMDQATYRGLLEFSARSGVAAANTALGKLYADGSGGVTKDPAKAYEYYRKGIEGRDREAYTQAGYALATGNGIAKDTRKAFPILKTAADAGDPSAQYLAGFLLSRGDGVDKDESQAVAFFTKASDAGHDSAKAELGFAIYSGRGIAADRVKGRALIKEAADKGNEAGARYFSQINSQDQSQSGSPGQMQARGVPKELQADVEKLAGNEPFSLNRANMPFMAGMAQYLTEKCGLPRSGRDRAELVGLYGNGISSMLGNDYSNPDLGKMMGNMMGSQALFVAGSKLAEQIGCNTTLASHVADRLVEASRSNKGGGNSPFLASCARAFDETRCGCLGQIGRGVIPDIYQKTYHRQLIQEIISRNPLTGLTIAAACQIVNY